MKAFGRGDIRREGSGNIGATNVWRVHGAKLGVPVIFVDIAKGLVPALLGAQLVGPLTGVLAGAAAMLGPWRPLFLRFQRGGKIVATTGGAFFGLAPYAGLVAAAVWLVFFVVFRYASVSSLAAAVALPVSAFLLGYSWPIVVFAAVAMVAVFLLHRANISRLRAGDEKRFSFSRRSSSLA